MPAENGGSADFCRLAAGFDWVFSLFGPVQKRAVGAGVRAAAGALRSFFRSKFKAPKTPPSHGLTGFGAIKPIAKNRRFFPGPDAAAALRAQASCAPGNFAGQLRQAVESGPDGGGLQRKILFRLPEWKNQPGRDWPNSLARGMAWVFRAVFCLDELNART